jgi:hypothetical protein
MEQTYDRWQRSISRRTFPKTRLENLRAIYKKLIKASTPQASTSFIDVSMPKCKNMHAPHT